MGKKNADKEEHYNHNFDHIQSVDDVDCDDDGENVDHLQGVELLVDHCDALGVPCAPVRHYFQLFCNLK